MSALEKVHRLVLEQAEDDGLWFVAETASEAYLQQELRRLAAAIEEVCDAYFQPGDNEKSKQE